MEFDESFWDERYRQHGAHSSVWSGQPNAQLVAEAAELVPGSALDVGAGEGADAVWLARHGWRVTAVDISSVALARAASAVRGDPATAARITWKHQDLTAAPPPAGTFDLVSAQYLHLPPAQRDGVYGQLAASVAPGGTLLIVGHHPSDLETSVRRPSVPGLLFTAEQVAAQLDLIDWEILTCVSRPRTATDSDGAPVTVQDSVLRARRRP